MSDEAWAGYDSDIQFRQRFFLSDNQRVDVSRLEDSNHLRFFLSNGIFSRISVADLNCNRGIVASAAHSVLFPFLCGVYSYSSAVERNPRGQLKAR